MPHSWNKGFTKETHPSILKISKTMKERKIDNFKKWRERMKLLGKIPSTYPVFAKNGDLAELIGVVLGDGHIRKFSRTEELSIFANSQDRGFIKRYSFLMESIFGKKPTLTQHGRGNCTRIRLYQKKIQTRLDIPYSPRIDLRISIPSWILDRKEYIVRYLRGLYEAEGSFCIHKGTYTYKLLFSNKNISMLNNVYKLLKMLGFSPHRSTNQIQLSRKKEVYEALELLHFRKY